MKKLEEESAVFTVAYWFVLFVIIMFIGVNQGMGKKIVPIILPLKNTGRNGLSE